MEQAHYLLPRRRVAGLLFFFLLLFLLTLLSSFSSIAPSLSLLLRLHRSIHGLLSLTPTPPSLSVSPPPHPSSSVEAFRSADSLAKTDLSNCSTPAPSSSAASSRAQAPIPSTLPFESVSSWSSSPSQLQDLPGPNALPILRSDDLLSCDISDGEWALDGRHYPLYHAKYCPYVDEAFSCQENGRPDSDYLKWTWKPNGCNLPRLEARSFLEKLRGKRMVFAGDSLMRNQWESMLCLLREGLTDKSRIIEARGQKITKGKGAYAFKFLDYNLMVEFYATHFLVAEGRQAKGPTGKSRLTLRLDTLDRTSTKWRKADILVFTTGHWWNHGKTARGKDYFQERDVVYESLPVMEAFQKAMKTWASWVDENVNAEFTKVFFCGYSPAHFTGGPWNSGGRCDKETEPISNASLLAGYPEKMHIIEKTLKQMKTPVQILNVTRFSEFRKDAHPSIYGQLPQQKSSGQKRPQQDCSHWCLPGVPDTWNAVLYAYL